MRMKWINYVGWLGGCHVLTETRRPFVEPDHLDTLELHLVLSSIFPTQSAVRRAGKAGGIGRRDVGSPGPLRDGELSATSADIRDLQRSRGPPQTGSEAGHSWSFSCFPLVVCCHPVVRPVIGTLRWRTAVDGQAGSQAARHQDFRQLTYYEERNRSPKNVHRLRRC